MKGEGDYSPKYGKKLIEISVIIFVAIGISEILAGVFMVRSIALTADGVDSLASATVSSIVWFGLVISRKAPDEKFHFGYYKVESFASVIAAFVMVVISALLFYKSYLSFVEPEAIALPAPALAVVLAAGFVTTSVSIFKMSTAKKSGFLSLKVDAYNAIKDSMTSFVAFFGILFSSVGLLYMDAAAGMAIAFFISTVAYTALKEGSLVLMDAYFGCEDVVGSVEQIALGIDGVKRIGNIRLRWSGPFLICRLEIKVDGSISVYEGDEIASRVENETRKRFAYIKDMTVEIKPDLK